MSWKRLGFAFLAINLSLCACGQSPDVEDGGASYNSGQELLESIFVPMMPGAPFSLTLSTEWAKPMANGGTYTIANRRPIRRDGQGRIYQERWLMAPKGSNIPSRMSWIQIADPIAHTLLECTPVKHICELRTLRDSSALRLHPERFTSGSLKGGRGTHTHEDLGSDSFAGLPVHHYRETTRIPPGTLGNDLEMVDVRDFRFSPELGLNLWSIVERPSLGRQSFQASDVSTGEPDPAIFQPPQGYRIVDLRQGVAGVQQATPQP